METARAQETCNCDTANFFMCDMPSEMQDALALRCLVNSTPTEILPAGEVYRLPNDLSGTANALELAGTRMTTTAFYPELADGVPLAPEDLQMYVGARDSGETEDVDEVRQTLQRMIDHPGTVDTMRSQYQIRLRQMDEEDRRRAASKWEQEGGNGEGVFLLALNRTTLGEGEVDAETMSVADLMQLSEELGEHFGVFWDDLSSVYNSMGGRLARAIVSQAHKFETTFQNVNELVGRQINLADQIRMRRIFLQEIFSVRPARVVTNRGQKLITFRGPAGNRVFLSRTAFPAGSMTVLNANLVAGNNAQAIRSSFGTSVRGSGGFFMIIGGIVEVVNWLSLPDSERFLGDLVANLGLVVALGVFTAVASTAMVTLGLAAAGIALPVVVTGLLIGAVGVGVGMLASWAVGKLGIRDFLQRNARRFFSGLRAFARQIMPEAPQVFYDTDWHPINEMGLIEGINYINNAPPEEAMEILERGFGGG